MVLSLKLIATQCLFSQLNGSNLFSWLDVFDRFYEFRDLFHRVAAFICQHFLLLSSMDQFLALDETRMKWIISNKKLVASEACLMEALIKWYKYDRSRREASFKDLFSFINLEVIDWKFLASMAEKERLYKILPELKTVINKKRKFFSFSRQRNIEMSAKYLNIGVIGFHDGLFVNERTVTQMVGGVIKCWQPFMNREFTDVFERTWLQYGFPLPEYLESDSVVIENKIYMLRSGLSAHSCQNKAEPVILLDTHCVCRDPELETRPLYYLLCYDIANGSCTVESILETKEQCIYRFRPSLVRAGSYLYAFLLTTDKNPRILVNRFNPQLPHGLRNWESLNSSKNHHGIYTEVVPYGVQYFYFIDHNFECYDVFTDTWRPLASVPDSLELRTFNNHHRFRAVVLGEQIVVISTNNDRGTHFEAMAYSPLSDTWKLVSKDPIPIEYDHSRAFPTQQFIWAVDEKSLDAKFYLLRDVQHKKIDKVLLCEAKRFFDIFVPSQPLRRLYSVVALNRETVDALFKRAISPNTNSTSAVKTYQFGSKFP